MSANHKYTDKPNRWSSHSKIAAMLEGLPRGARVLDVGCGSGMLARMCDGRGYILTGIEPDADQSAEAYQQYSEIITSSLEDTPDQLLAGYEAVVCGDVLEHLLRPEEQLRRLVQAQSNKCIFIVSVPNIANIWVRLNLLRGKFEYAERGILDRTHLHFYTRKTFMQLLHDAGLKILEVEATPIPLDLAAPSFSLSAAGKALFWILSRLAMISPGLFGYQWVAKATNQGDE